MINAATGVITHELKRDGAVLSLTFSPDGTGLAVGSADSKVALVDVATVAVRCELDRGGSYVDTLAFSPDGATLAVGGEDCQVGLYDHASLLSVP